jgi:hypothetical protein
VGKEFVVSGREVETNLELLNIISDNYQAIQKFNGSVDEFFEYVSVSVAQFEPCLML